MNKKEVHREKMGKGTKNRCTKTQRNKSMVFPSGKCWWSKRGRSGSVVFLNFLLQVSSAGGERSGIKVQANEAQEQRWAERELMEAPDLTGMGWYLGSMNEVGLLHMWVEVSGSTCHSGASARILRPDSVLKEQPTRMGFSVNLACLDMGSHPSLSPS